VQNSKQDHTVYLIGIDDENLAKPMPIFIQKKVTPDWLREHANKTMPKHYSKRRAKAETRLHNATVTKAR